MSSPRSSLRTRLGSPPIADSLATVNWFVRMLGEMADEVLNEVGLSKTKRRAELLKIVDRATRLRDLDRIYRAEKALLGNEQQLNETTTGPQTEDAPNASEQARTVPARRGRPRRG